MLVIGFFATSSPRLGPAVCAQCLSYHFYPDAPSPMSPLTSVKALQVRAVSEAMCTVCLGLSSAFQYNNPQFNFLPATLASPWASPSVLAYAPVHSVSNSGVLFECSLSRLPPHPQSNPPLCFIVPLTKPPQPSAISQLLSSCPRTPCPVFVVACFQYDDPLCLQAPQNIWLTKVQMYLKTNYHICIEYVKGFWSVTVH